MSYTIVHNATYPESIILANAVVIAGKYVGLNIQSGNISVTDIKEYSDIRVLPSLKTPSGNVSLVGALKYVGSSGLDSTLNGADRFEQAAVDQWLAFAPTFTPRYQALHRCQEGDKITNLRNLVESLKVVNEVLIRNTFLVGNTFTVADIYLALILRPAFENYFGPKVRKELSGVTRWFKTVVGQSNVKKVIGVVGEQTENVYIPAELSAAPKKVEKVINPLDQLPKSDMKLDDIKRLYCSARPFNPNFAEEFWPLFDADGWSIITLEFKYKEDWDKDFLAENMINGFINRSEAARRYCMGVLNLYFDGKFYQAKGAYLVRGEGVPAVLEDVSDFEEYEAQVLNARDEEDRKKWISLLCAEEINGFPVISRHMLK